ncbi:hypothetical protein [Salinicola socius]|uniref:Uncharacterized protein n=1 Tax=Salinicola socius TaxID=404433 RepID=A0A1Q8SQJ5_9GAMM|nr:hypothetical protein [Salinicola socius]OLO03662.1 hypothetical protein BTW07_13835 [Salinicola socius]
MRAIEFEVDIQDGVVRIPDEYAYLMNKHAKIVVLYDASAEEDVVARQREGIDFSGVIAPSLTAHDGVEYQRSQRDEW